MVDVNQSNRPTSPHLQIYRLPFPVVLSILNRITGVGMSLAMVLMAWWFLAAATSPAYFDYVDGWLTSWLGILVLVGSLWAFWFHFFNGLRHLRWDAGLSMGKWAVGLSGKISVVLSFVVTLLCLIFGL